MQEWEAFSFQVWHYFWDAARKKATPMKSDKFHIILPLLGAVYLFVAISCVFSLALLVDQQSRHWRNGCAPSCNAPSHREMFQVAIRLTGQLKPWLYVDTKTLWSKFKESYEKWKKVNYYNCLSKKKEFKLKLVILQVRTGLQHETWSCSLNSFIFISFAANGLTSGRRTKFKWTSH